MVPLHFVTLLDSDIFCASLIQFVGLYRRLPGQGLRRDAHGSCEIASTTRPDFSLSPTFLETGHLLLLKASIKQRTIHSMYASRSIATALRASKVLFLVCSNRQCILILAVRTVVSRAAHVRDRCYRNVRREEECKGNP